MVKPLAVGHWWQPKWGVVGLLWLVSFINYADRNAITAVMPMIRSDFQLDNAALGLLSSSFLWVYASAAMLVGVLGDRYSRKWVIIWGLVAWSFFTLVSPLASIFPLFLILRALTGLGEACYYPAGTALISDFHDDRTRGKALSIHQTAVFAGGALGTVGAAWIAGLWSWHDAFYLYGVLGIAYALLLARILPGNTSKRRERVVSLGRETPYALLKRIPAVWILCLVYFFANSVSNGLLIWAPTLFVDELHMSLTGASLFGAATLNLAGFIAVLCSGVIADWAVSRHRAARFSVLTIGLAAALVFTAAIAIAHSATTVAICLLCAGFFKGIFDGSIYSSMHDLVPPSSRATAVGLMTTLGFAGAGLCPLLIGIGADHIGLPLSLGLTALLDCAAVALLLLGRPWFRRAVDVTLQVEQQGKSVRHS
ncbi:MFS transporter [Carnimonas bestiolae]|uniref:MFS transporter n=1 Tax=Carnimonas bestiolae TaxID=3402172 RepID=UPI003EDC34A4